MPIYTSTVPITLAAFGENRPRINRGKIISVPTPKMKKGYKKPSQKVPSQIRTLPIPRSTQKAKRVAIATLEWEFLVELYLIASDYENAFRVYKDAVLRFPESWRLHFFGGEIHEHKKEYNEALCCYGKAGELGTYFHDEYYAKASCLDEMGEYEKSAEIYSELCEILLSEGYDEEAEMAKNQADRIMLKIK